MNYSKALDIARSLAGSSTKEANLLREACQTLGRIPTFVIMRYGDPRKWKELPEFIDARTAKRKYTKYNYRRPVRLQNIDTGQISRAGSIIKFCDKYLGGKNKEDRFHVTPVLNGDRPSFKRWFLPETLARKVELRDIYGNVSIISFRDGVKKHGIPPSTLISLLNGRKRAMLSNRVMLAETPVDSKIKPRNYKITRIQIEKGNKTVTGKSVYEVARKAGIKNVNGVYSTGYGFRDNVNGFRVADVTIEQRRVLADV